MENKIYKWLFFAILTLPLVILQPFLSNPEWDKTIVFRIIMAVIMGIFLWDVFKNRTDGAIKAKIKPIKTLFILFSVFFLLVLLSTVFSQDISFSLWGSPYRAGGFVTFSFYFFFSILAFLIIKPDDWNKILNWALVVGWMVSLVAIFQSFSIFNKFLVAFDGGPPSTTGNSILLALYCLLLFFIALAFFIKAEGRRQKAFYAATAALLAFTILISSSRAAYLGIIAGLFYFIFFYPKRSKKLKLVKIVGAAMLALIVAIVIYVNAAPQLPDFIKQNKILSNVSARLSYKLIIGESRFSGWQVMLDAVKEKPFLGWGPENLQMGYDKYYNPNLPQIIKLWWDRAHNFMLEIAVSSGVPALIAYILFFVFLFFRLEKIKKRHPIDCHMVQSAFIAYFVDDFFSLDGLTTYIILFLLIGYSFHLILKDSGWENLARAETPEPRKNKLVLYLIIASVSVFILSFNILPFVTNFAVSRASSLASDQNCGQAISLMDKKINDKNFVAPYLRLKFAEILRGCGTIDEQKSKEYAQKAFGILQKNIKDQPKFTRLWVSLAGFGNVLIGQEQDLKKRNDLITLVQGYEKTGLSMAPKRQDLFLEMSKTYYVTKNYPSMEQNSKDCLKISDEFEGCWWYLGIAEIFQGRQEDGKAHISQAESLGFHSNFFQLAEAYLSQKNYSDAADTFSFIVRYNPENAGYHAVLAALYKEIGKYSDAGREAFAVFKLQPENTEAQKFLKELGALSPNDPSIHFSLGLMYKGLNNKAQMLSELYSAEALYRQLIAAKIPDRAGNDHFALATIYKELENFTKAKEEALLALKLRPGLKPEVEEFLSSLPQ